MMIGLFRFLLLFVFLYIGWVLFFVLLYALRIIQRPEQKSMRNGYPYSSPKQNKVKIEYTDVQDAKFEEIKNRDSDVSKS